MEKFNDISNSAFYHFLFAIYYADYYDEYYLEEEDYEKIIAFLQTGYDISNEFLYTSPEIKKICLKYSLFHSFEVDIVQRLFEKKDPNLDLILEKYKTSEAGWQNRLIYGVLLEKYVGNYKRQIQVLSFKDYWIMVLVMQLMEVKDFNKRVDQFGIVTNVYRLENNLLAIVPEKYRREVAKFLRTQNYDELFELLKNVEAEVLGKGMYPPDNSKIGIKKYTFPWEEKVRNVIKNNDNATKFFKDLGDDVECEDNERSDEQIGQKYLIYFNKKLK